jgi:hypothetical protein
LTTLKKPLDATQSKPSGKAFTVECSQCGVLETFNMETQAYEVLKVSDKALAENISFFHRGVQRLGSYGHDCIIREESD